MKKNNNSYISYLPKVRGSLLFGKDLSKISWLKVGGLAEIFFIPYDLDSNFAAFTLWSLHHLILTLFDWERKNVIVENENWPPIPSLTISTKDPLSSLFCFNL